MIDCEGATAAVNDIVIGNLVDTKKIGKKSKLYRYSAIRHQQLYATANATVITAEPMRPTTAGFKPLMMPFTHLLLQKAW